MSKKQEGLFDDWETSVEDVKLCIFIFVFTVLIIGGFSWLEENGYLQLLYIF